MQTGRTKANRWLALAASVMVALGSLLVVQGSAEASTPVAHYPVIRFWSAYNEVTMNLPARIWCPKFTPDCEWQLYVNEPDIPGGPEVGMEIGRSGVLTVAYPKNFCGILQADAIVGPSPWYLQFGHQKMIKTGTECGGTTTTDPSTTTTTSTSTTTTSTTTTSTTEPRSTTTTTKPRPTTTTTRPRSTTTTTKAKSSLPFTSTPAPAAAVAAAAAAATSTTTGKTEATTAQLPFTGADVRPLLFLGVALIILGIYILTTLEQRRRMMRRMSYSLRSSEAARYANRTSRWFFGE